MPKELFSHIDPDGDIVSLSGRPGFQPAITVNGKTAYLDQDALERLARVLAEELGQPVDPQASTRRAQALVAASRTVAATIGSDAVIATAQAFERYLSGESAPAAEPAAEDVEDETPEGFIKCRSCGHPHYGSSPDRCGYWMRKECPCRVSPCPDCGHPSHVNLPCGIPQTTENGRPARCRCGLQDVPMEAVQEKCTDCGHAPHTGMACGKLRHPKKGDVMERCRCGLEETAAAITPAECRECTHPHELGKLCPVTVTTPSGRTVVCGCLQ